MLNVVSVFLTLTVSGTNNDLIPENPQRWDYGVISDMSLTLNLINAKFFVNRKWATDMATACTI